MITDAHCPDRGTSGGRRIRFFGPAALAVLALVVGLFAAGCRQTGSSPDGGPEPTTLTIFHAGSLSVPFRELSALYQQRHPHVKVLAEAAGSRDTARKVSDLGRSCDVLASADFRVVENLLMPAHADFNIRFATGEIVIAYTDESAALEKVTAEGWPDVLLQDEVTFGRSDPNRDPCGYRTVMVFQLAERHYQRVGLAQQLGAKHDRKYIRPKETDLLALLEFGELDYLFIYRSVAAQHHLRFLTLPERINLSSPKFADLYGQAKVEVTGRKPGETLTISGAPIHY
ncbi:MAG: substrate-binding domain-containing protein, partial [Deltaproteobacteria bacterium]|nr:substrate-binding domain-containing protein [Deltaproteobacteria bacterium]